MAMGIFFHWWALALLVPHGEWCMWLLGGSQRLHLVATLACLIRQKALYFRLIGWPTNLKIQFNLRGHCPLFSSLLFSSLSLSSFGSIRRLFKAAPGPIDQLVLQKHHWVLIANGGLRMMRKKGVNRTNKADERRPKLFLVETWRALTGR